MNTTQAGKRGEDIAKTYLQANGFIVRHVNWRWQHKELDIVAEKNNTLHIVEVKSRIINCLTDPLTSVNRRKQQNLIAAANAYVQQFNIANAVQMDIIVVLIDGEKYEIAYIPQAYYPTIHF